MPLEAFGVLPLVTLPALILPLRSRMPPWGFMWAMAFALYASCKWLTYWEVRTRSAAIDGRRAIGYLVAWPGMDAASFLGATGTDVAKPAASEWIAAALKTVLGATLTWVVARTALPAYPLAAGWLGMIGLIFVLHFGTFHLLSLGWRSVRVNAMPVMRNPSRSTSLAEFWGRRWNTAFHELAARFTFAPLRRLVGVPGASVLVFLGSGLIHELVISVPAHAGYGLPTAYFVLQGMGIAAERTERGRRLGLGRGVRGWVFTFVVASGPAFWLFHPPFVHTVILPMLAVIGAS
jgi:Membrane bound O-acyl transferase family